MMQVDPVVVALGQLTTFIIFFVLGWWVGAGDVVAKFSGIISFMFMLAVSAGNFMNNLGD